MVFGIGKKHFLRSFYDEGIRIKYIMMMLDLFYEYLKNRNSELVVFNSFSDKISYPKRNYFLNKFETWNDFITSYDNKHEKGVNPIEYGAKNFSRIYYMKNILMNKITYMFRNYKLL